MRLGYLDLLRALAIIWMIIFHVAYDMNSLQFIQWDFNSGFWYAFPRVIAWTFLFCVGVALNIVHTPKINWPSLTKRSIKLAAAALAVSIGTYFMFPQQWVYFGTLHCILVGSILGALIVKNRILCWFLLGLILILQYGLAYDIKWVSSLLQRQSMDFIPIYPWFWAILAGIVISPYLNQIRFLRELPVPKAFSFLARHSLKIYLIHQPVIFGVLSLLKT